LFRDLGFDLVEGPLFSVDGGPLTDNVVLSSVQRALGLNRTAELLAFSGSSPRSGTGLAEGESGQAELDWKNPLFVSKQGSVLRFWSSSKKPRTRS